MLKLEYYRVENGSKVSTHKLQETCFMLILGYK